MNRRLLATIENVNDPAYSFPIFESGFDVGTGQVPATRDFLSPTVGVYCSEPVRFLAESRELRPPHVIILDDSVIRSGRVTDRFNPLYFDIPIR